MFDSARVICYVRKFGVINILLKQTNFVRLIFIGVYIKFYIFYLLVRKF